MIVLGIESSCDETGVALVKTVEVSPGAAPTWPVLLAQALHSQIEMHQAYGGVVPELASRDHIRRVIPLTQAVLDQAGVQAAEIDVVAFTRGPGLAGAVLVGAGVLQLLIVENAAQSVSDALKQLLLRKVLHPDMDTEITQLDLLSRCHEVGLAQSEEAMDFFVNHPHRRLHMGVKLFPTGLLLKSVVAAAKAAQQPAPKRGPR